jgi:nucleoside-diphosphate-sugar epimerase
MKFVVTGGAGFIGSHLTEYLVEHGNYVIVIDDLNTGKIENLQNVYKKIEFIKGDIRDNNLLRKTFKDVDGIFHQAALASVQESFTMPEKYHDVNVNGTENIFKLAKEFGLKVVYASSSSIYGNPLELPIKEDAQRSPINPYAQTKVDKEFLAEKYVKMGVDIIGLRYFNVYGDRQSVNYAGVIKLFLERIQSRKPPKINGDGLQERDFVYVKDVVRANMLAMQSTVKHAFINVGTGKSVSVIDLANMIISASGLSIKPIHGPELKGDVKATKADITLAKKLLNWQPEMRLEDWLSKTITNMMKSN